MSYVSIDDKLTLNGTSFEVIIKDLIDLVSDQQEVLTALLSAANEEEIEKMIIDNPTIMKFIKNPTERQMELVKIREL